MRGCGPQFMDHMRSVSRGRLQILSLASEVDRLRKSSGNNYVLLVSKQIQRVANGPLWLLPPPPHCGVCSYATGHLGLTWCYLKHVYFTSIKLSRFEYNDKIKYRRIFGIAHHHMKLENPPN